MFMMQKKWGKMEELRSDLAEILEVDSVEDSHVLRDFDSWDSLASLAIQATCDKKYKVSISPEDLAAIVTIADLISIVNSRSSSV